MVAVTQHLEEKKQKRAPDVEGDLSKAHTGLMRQLWTRATIIEALKDCTYKLIEQNGRVAIEIVPPVSKEVTPWHHMGSQGRIFKLFSTNSKMMAPTFDLPSGITEVGGSCPAARFGQTTALGQKLVEMTGSVFTAERSFSNLLDERQVEWEAMRVYQKAHGLPEAPPFKRSLKLQDAVCNSCYASSGKYGETSTQLGELVRFGWVQSLVKSNPEQLVETLFRTINETKLEGESKERFPYRFIRVHSSGDFFSPAYAKVWLDVARLLEQAELEAKARGDTSRPPVRLWAPTRTNFLPGMLSFWKRERATMPGNFAIRFSGYAIGDPAPYIHRPSPTKCKGTSVLSEAETKVLRKSPGEKFDWQCGVYDLGKGDKTCLAAKAPDGEVGCRACWLHPEFAVNYAQH